MVFTGVMAFLIAIFYSVVCCVEGLKRTFSGAVEAIISGLWVIFWLASAGSFAAFAPCRARNVEFRTFTKCDVFLASQAFAWLSLFLWIGSFSIAVIEMRRGEGITGGARASTACFYCAACLLPTFRDHVLAHACMHALPPPPPTYHLCTTMCTRESDTPRSCLLWECCCVVCDVAALVQDGSYAAHRPLHTLLLTGAKRYPMGNPGV